MSPLSQKINIFFALTVNQKLRNHEKRKLFFFVYTRDDDQKKRYHHKFSVIIESLYSNYLRYKNRFVRNITHLNISYVFQYSSQICTITMNLCPSS